MAARRASSLWRGIIVALGCVSAVWMIFVNCEIIADYIKIFIKGSSNILNLFFTPSFAALFIGLSFFAIIIRDLWALKRPLLWIALIFSAIYLILIAVRLISSPISLQSSGSIILLLDYVSDLLLMVSYILFAVAGINSRRKQPFAFYFGVISALLVLGVSCADIFSVSSQPSFNSFVPYLSVFAAHLFLFKCALYEK